MKTRSALKLSVTLTCAAVLLAACGRTAEDTSATVATVNGDKITQAQLDFATKQEQEAAEQLPPALLDKVATMKEGQSVVVPSQFGVAALTLISSASAPKTLADARPAIEQFLTNQGRREVIMNLQKTLRDGAKVEYQGRFAALASASGDGPAPMPASSPVLSAAPAASNAAPAASQKASTQK